MVLKSPMVVVEVVFSRGVIWLFFLECAYSGNGFHDQLELALGQVRCELRLDGQLEHGVNLGLGQSLEEGQPSADGGEDGDSSAKERNRIRLPNDIPLTRWHLVDVEMI